MVLNFTEFLNFRFLIFLTLIPSLFWNIDRRLFDKLWLLYLCLRFRCLDIVSWHTFVDTYAVCIAFYSETRKF